MPEYPLPVEHLTSAQAVRLVCPSCGRERDAVDEEIGYGEIGAIASCECSAGLEWKYAPATRCPGCGRLGWWEVPPSYGDACSRACHLQVEYAKELAAKRA